MPDILWVLVSAAFVFLMQPGFMCLESGLTRAKNSINVALKNLADIGVSIVLFWVIGFGIMFGATSQGWFGTTDFFHDVEAKEAWPAVFFLFQAMFCGTATTIVSGAVAERMRFAGYIILAIIVSAFVYTVFGHWAWNSLYSGEGGGWLEGKGFVDFAGSTVVHSIGAWVALAAVIVVGPRIGRFDEHGNAHQIPGNNTPLAILGVLIIWFGWIGFNGGSTLAADETVPVIVAHTVMAGASGLVAGSIFGLFKGGRVDVTLTMNGALAGLVAITASCHAVTTPEAVLIGVIGAVIMGFADMLLERLHIDDAVGAIPVHGAAGVWGTLAVGVFGDPVILGTGLSQVEQIQVQLLGAGVAFAWAFGVTLLILLAVRLILPLRVEPHEEIDGLNVTEHGATTELYELFTAMENQARSGDVTMRVPVEPFTEVGQIGRRYNQVLEALEGTAARTEAIVRNANDAIFTFRPYDLTITWANMSSSTMFNIPVTKLIGRPADSVFVKATLPPKAAGGLAALIDRGRVEAYGMRGQRDRFPVEVVLTETRTGSESFITATIRDITRQKQSEQALRESEERYMLAARGANDGLWDWDLKSGRVHFSQRWKRMFGYRDHEIGESPTEWFDLVHPDDLPGLRDILMEQPRVKKMSHVSHEFRIRKSTGEYVWALIRGLVVYDPSGRPRRIAGSLTDITERKDFEEKLQHEALHDNLTGLPNRNMLLQRLEAVMKRSEEVDGYSFAVLFLDLDRFKVINDSLGHLVGDRLLKEVAARIQDSTRGITQRHPETAQGLSEEFRAEFDTVARLGGDEFAILLDGVNSHDVAIVVAERIQARLGQPFILDSNKVYTSASIGIAMGGGEYNNPEDMLRNSDAAMYRAKGDGKARYELFDQELHEAAMRKLDLENALRKALEKEELELYYQPIMDIEARRVAGFEALVRWNHPDQGIISPGEFIPIAEESGLIVPMGTWIMEEACRAARTLEKNTANDENCYVAVNVSSHQFKQQDFLETVKGAVAKAGCRAEDVVLEITESVIMDDPDLIAKKLQTLRDRGHRLAIDDFGTGYSSLSYLHQFPINTVKIDRSFVSKIGPKGEGSELVEGIIGLCKRLGLDTTAEGVEKSWQFELLDRLGANYAQGYLLERPQPFAQASVLANQTFEMKGEELTAVSSR